MIDILERRFINDGLQINENIIEGRAITFNSDSVDMGFIERIDPQAITQDLINRSDVFCYFNHNTNQVLARSYKGQGSLELQLKSDGLYYRFSIPNTELGNELREHLDRGEIRGSSFAFTVPQDGSGEIITRDANNKVIRTITKIDGFYDVSPVFTPAYTETTCSKRMLDLLEENEKEIREMKEKVQEIEQKTEEIQEEIREVSVENEEIIEEKVEEIQEEKEQEVEQKSAEIEEINEKEERSSENIVEIKENQINKNKSININMKKNFSLLRAINDIANGKTLDPVNAEVVSLGQKELRDSGLAFNGQIQIPYETRATVTVTAEGEDVVATDVWDIMEPLRAKNVLAEAGADIYTGLVNNVKIPIMSKANCTWEGETSAASDASVAFTHVELSPKRLTTYVDISKQFLIQTENLGAEAKIRENIIKSVTSKLEETILGTEAGTTTQPAGMFYDVSVNTISDFADITDLEANVELENVFGDLKYVMDPKAKAALRNMPRSTDHSRLVLENGEVDGTPALVTSNVPTSKLVYGDWSNLKVGQWGGLDLVVDPYTQATNGCVRLVVNAYFDAKVARPEAFAFGQIDPSLGE